MAQREGSVYLYLFIAASVLFLGMTVLFFLGNAEQEKLLDARVKQDAKVKDLEDAVKVADAEIRNLRKAIGGDNMTDALDIESFKTTELKNKAESAVNAVRKELGEPAVEYSSLAQPYNDLMSLLPKLMQAREEAFKSRDSANDAQVKLKAATDEQLAALRTEDAKSKQEIHDLEAKVADLTNQFQTEKSKWVADMDKLKDDHTEQLITLNRTVNFKDNTIGNLNSRIDRLQEETRKQKEFEDVEPDGRIVSLVGATGKGYIDVGRTKHLRNGIVFRVFQYVKGGKKEPKGRVEITKVDENMSEFRILEMEDELNPIVGGDYITSPFYDPKVQPVFVFAGTELETRETTKETLVAKMKTYGATIVDKVDPKVDFLVATKNYESTPEYKAARELGVAVLRERDLLEFIGR
jgi:hypothetical protein